MPRRGAMFEARTVQEYLEMASDPARRKGELMHQMVIGESRRQVHHLGYAMAPETHRHQFMATEGQTYDLSEHTLGKRRPAVGSSFVSRTVLGEPILSTTQLLKTMRIMLSHPLSDSPPSSPILEVAPPSAPVSAVAAAGPSTSSSSPVTAAASSSSVLAAAGPSASSSSSAIALRSRIALAAAPRPSPSTSSSSSSAIAGPSTLQPVAPAASSSKLLAARKRLSLDDPMSFLAIKKRPWTDMDYPDSDMDLRAKKLRWIQSPDGERVALLREAETEERERQRQQQQQRGQADSMGP
ncbi:hypothetical protein BDZ90DRAFT_33909 [Jaminaea rosea]|uniref:Uncharacterized protein n=1 Tax=Jaminaea rosea TaxID=1569628 RepID=A0A316V239_9BASI|nr:hypothetical protein BDZ90DRAFT_33909 [Jaminaea rosea]PWN31068.1 hypothetical protein BDZ90DRAFT_33909 [Jaminaea rosea]